MLNRRNAILAASGTVFLAGRNCAETHCSGSAIGSTLPFQVENAAVSTAQQVAAACMECAAACSGVVGVVSEDESIVSDCKDICTVTATLLARRDAFSPAICQSCADACCRLVLMCNRMETSPALLKCRDAALKCTKVCDLHVSRTA